jgi:hypothetical protein
MNHAVRCGPLRSPGIPKVLRNAKNLACKYGVATLAALLESCSLEGRLLLIDSHLSGTFCADRKNRRGGKKMKLKPLGARALVKDVEREQTTAGVH